MHCNAYSCYVMQNQSCLLGDWQVYSNKKNRKSSNFIYILINSYSYYLYSYIKANQPKCVTVYSIN